MSARRYLRMPDSARMWAICAVLLVAILMRWWGIGYDLPYIYHPDEPFNFSVTQRMFASGSLNPHFFGYPSLLYYVNDFAFGAYSTLGRAVGLLHSTSDIRPLLEQAMGATQASQPGLVLFSRTITAAFGTGTVGLVYLLGRRLLNDDAVALLGASVTALAAPNVVLSRLITPDTLATFFAVATVLAAAHILRGGRPIHYVVGGFVAGLAASTKYNAGIIVVALVAAHLLASGVSRRLALLFIAALACGAGFVIATPFVVLDYSAFVRDLKFDAQVYATGHPGMDGNTLFWYLGYMWRTAGVVYILATLQIGRGILTRSRPTIILAVFPVLYFGFICGFEVRNDRTLLPLTPFMYLLGAMFLTDAVRGMLTVAARIPERIRLAIGVLAALCAVGQAAAATIDETKRTIGSESRRLARIWIERNVAEGSRVAVEAYSPFIDPKRFRVAGFTRITEHDLPWYEHNEFDYLVLSQGMYGRFFRERGRFPKDVAEYDALFTRLTPTAVFPDRDYEIRVYRIRDGTKR